MCMCGMTLTRRQWLTMALTASAGALVPGKRAQAAELSAAAADVLQKTITVDTHSHAGGLVFGPKMDDSLASGMRAGSLSAVCLAHVADGPVIGRTAGGGLGMVRSPHPETCTRRTSVDSTGWTASPAATACAASPRWRN